LNLPSTNGTVTDVNERPRSPEERPGSWPSATSFPVTRRVAGAGGTGLAVTEAGDPAAPTVVLVHGYPDDATMWAPIATRLADRFHVVAYDTRGSGASAAPRRTDAYRLELLVEDLAAVADATSPDRPVHLVGHDWGSVQGWEAVTTDRMAGRIAGFTSMSGPCLDHAGRWIRTARSARTAGTARRASAVRQLAVRGLRSWHVVAFHLPGARLFWRLGGGRIVHRALVRAGELPPGTVPSPTLARSGANGVRLYRANMLPRIRRPGERRTDVPVQLLVPTHDRFLHPDLFDGVERWAPHLRRRSVPGRHWLPRLAPDLVADAVAGWVDHVESGKADGDRGGGAGDADDRSARAPGTDRVEGARALRQPGSRTAVHRAATADGDGERGGGAGDEGEG
jgi:pimeloyl-ACP methyl ester carboxylesterase